MYTYPVDRYQESGKILMRKLHFFALKSMFFFQIPKKIEPVKQPKDEYTHPLHPCNRKVLANGARRSPHP
jgi:hypothetical protein